MARELSPRDIEILKKLAPECSGLECAGSNAPYRSILPPLSNHLAKSEEDFRKRISSLDSEDLDYLLALIKTGEESLGCVPPHYMTIFLEFINEKVGREVADEIMDIYVKLNECKNTTVTTLF